MKDYEQIEKDYPVYDRIKQAVAEFAQEYLDEFKPYGDNRLDTAWIEDDFIKIEWTDNQSLVSHSSYLTNLESVPVECLWNPDWIYDLREAEFKANTEAVMAREAKIKAEKEATADERYRQYLKMKEEYEG